ncbi:MAG: hypothetical protein A2Y41_12365 [Spirochaetes bacterium GWB1_36_13]|nr:MAG: hypothetical protein A2Y41_12365 [Spirochaetes bacterium GWB1_36_13]
MKKILFMIALFLFSTIRAEEKIPGKVKRVSNMDVVIVIDDSGSMKPIFSKVIQSIKTNILENFIIDGDNIHIILFSTDTRLLYAQNNVNHDKLLESFGPVLTKLKSEGQQTDIGRVMSFLKTYLETKTSLEKKFVFFLTDGVNDPAPESEYFPYKDRIAQKLQSITDPIKLQGYNFLCFGIGFKTDIKLVADMVGGEYIEISKSFNENEFKTKLSSMIGFLDISSDPDLGRVSKTKSINMKLVSNYVMPVKSRIIKAYFKEIADQSKPYIKETENLLVNPVEIFLESGKEISLEIELSSIPDLPGGDYTAFLSFEMENKVKLSPSSLKISFYKGTSWFLWFLGFLILLWLFKKYVVLILIRFRFFRGLKTFLYLKKEKLKEKKPKLFFLLKKISDRTDKAALGILKGVFFLSAFILSLFSWGIFFPIGFVFDKIGNIFLWIHIKSKNIRG